ncbi:MAG: Cof-type HAD-IIB family hydrolase [Candidatus Izemoplasmatales bacterium]
MYKLVAMDLDGTLFNQAKKISPANLAAINDLKARNINIVIASGRTYNDIMELVSQLDLENYNKGYVIGYNGVIAAKTKPYQIIFKKTINGYDVRRIAGLVESFGFKMHVFCDNQILLSEHIERITKSDRDLIATAVTMPMTNYTGPDEVYKVLILDDETKLNTFQSQIPKPFFADYTIVKSASTLLEFAHLHGSKGNALAKLAQHLHLKQEEIMAFGDEENDISMLQYAGLGIAMGNAKESVKEKARAITKSNIDDGVAIAIHKYIIGDEIHGF